MVTPGDATVINDDELRSLGDKPIFTKRVNVLFHLLLVGHFARSIGWTGAINFDPTKHRESGYKLI